MVLHLVVLAMSSHARWAPVVPAGGYGGLGFTTGAAAAAPGSKSSYANVVGRWSTHPAATPSDMTVDGPLGGNGVTAVILGGPPSFTSWHFGMNHFVRSAAMTSAAMPWGPAAPGGLDMQVAAMSNASYAAVQHISNGSIATAFSKPGVGTLSSSSFMAPLGIGGAGVSMLVTMLHYYADSSSVHGDQPSLEVRLTARAGPLGKGDDFLICGPAAADESALSTQRANGEDWQVPVLPLLPPPPMPLLLLTACRRQDGVLQRGRPRPGGYGAKVTRVAVAVRAYAASGLALHFSNTSVALCGSGSGSGLASGSLSLRPGEPITLLTAIG